MLVTMKNTELIDKLVTLAEGDFELVHEAVRRSARGSDGADLKDVVAYIVGHRRPKEVAAVA